MVHRGVASPCGRSWPTLVAIATVMGFAWPSAARAVDLNEIVARGSLRVLVASDEQPEMFALTGDPPGFEREVMEGFVKSRGLKLEVVTVPNFEKIVPMLLKADGDVIIGIVDTELRRRQIGFTIEILPARHLAVNRKPAPPFQNLLDLRKARVGVIQATSWAEAAAAAGVPVANTANFADLPGVMGALQSGKVAATVMSAPDFALAQRHDPTLQAGLFLGPPTSTAWGVRPGDKALVDALNDHIFTLRNSPSWGQLVSRYFNSEAIDLFRRARRPQ